MKQSFLMVVGSALLAYSLSASFSPAVSHVQAAEASSSSTNANESRIRRTPTLRPHIFTRLDDARALADEQNYTDALTNLQGLQRLRLNSYETAMLHNMFAYVYFNQEQYAAAIEAYEQLVTIDGIPESLEQSTLYSLAKLHMLQEDNKKALVALNRWFGLVNSPNAEAYILRAQMQFQLEQYSAALPDVKQAITLVKEQGHQPRENWLLLERAVYYSNRDFVSLARCLKDLATLYPKDQYWVQLAAVYNELGQPLKELSALETAYEQHLLTNERDLVNLAQALLGQEIPYKSAAVLEQGFERGQIEKNARHYSLLGDAWMLAKEYDRALTVMAHAAKLSQAGDDYYKLAQVHTERQEWDLALASVREAIDLGNLKHESSAYVLEGLIRFNMNDLVGAETSFQAAQSYAESERMAQQWLVYIASEKQRRDYMMAAQY